MQPAIHCHYTRLEAPETLRPHPRNPNKHGQRQIKLLARILEDHGFRHPIVVSELSGRIVAGHARREAAEYARFDNVPVETQPFASEQDELAFLVADNQISELAEMDSAELEAIVQELRGQDFSLETLGFDDSDFKLVERREMKKDTVDKISPDLPGAMMLKPGMLFESKAIYGIPELKPDLLADCPTPITTWIGPIRTERWEHHYLMVWNNDSIRDLPLDRTVACFYTYDDKFEDAWRMPDDFTTRLMNMKMPAVVTPNFSCYLETPKAVAIFNIYRSRWCGRFWQEAGLRVIPDIDFALADSFEYCCAGVPQNAPCIAIQNHVKMVGWDVQRAAQDGVMQIIDMLKPQSILVYAGEQSEELLSEVLPKELHVVYVMNAITKRRSFIKKS
jgi:hypothetical protein